MTDGLTGWGPACGARREGSERLVTTTEAASISDDASETGGRGRAGRRTLIVVGLVVLVIVALVAGVAGDAIGRRHHDAPIPLADVVTCSVWTRPSTSQLPVSAGTVTIDWRNANPAEDTTTEQHVSGDGLTFNAAYGFGGGGGHVLGLTATDRAGHMLHSTTYQMWQGPSDDFGMTGQGFTGLSYAYDPATGAEMQYWCTAS